MYIHLGLACKSNSINSSLPHFSPFLIPFIEPAASDEEKGPLQNIRRCVLGGGNEDGRKLVGGVAEAVG